MPNDVEAPVRPADEIQALTGDPNFMTSLARGLAVIRGFSQEQRRLSIAQLSQKTGIPRAAVRRVLYTLSRLGYVGSDDGRHFALQPRLLTLGHAYLSSTPLVAVVGKGMEGGFNPVTAPALIAVGTLMIGAVREIRWDDATEAVPAFMTFLLMPLTFSISHGLAVGIVVYVLVKVAAGRRKEVHWLMYGLAAAFLLRYALLPV